MCPSLVVRSTLTEGQSFKKKGKKTLTKKNHIPSFIFVCGAVLLTILPREMGENLKSQRGVRKTRVFVKDEKKREMEGVFVKCE